MGMEKYSISNTAIFDKLPDCPICNNIKNINHIMLIDFYRNISHD